MPLVLVASAKGSPGATSVSLRLAVELGHRLGSTYPAACLVDADPDGGDVGLLLGLAAAPSVATLALAGRHGFNEAVLISHCQRSVLLPGVAVLTGIAGRGQRSAVGWLAPPLAEVARKTALPVVVDAGRVGSIEGAQALYRAADGVVVVCDSSTPSIVHTRSALISLAAEGVEAGVVLVGVSKEPPSEIATALGRPLFSVISPTSPPAPLSLAARRSGHPLQGRARSQRSEAGEIEHLADVLLGNAEPLSQPAQRIDEHAPAALQTAIANMTAQS